MCGIVGIVAQQQFSVKNTLLKALKRLEYRGYDSVGYATVEGNVEKQPGEIDTFLKTVTDKKTTLAISHTRWATHGGVTQANAHPHWNSSKTIFAIHNGILENYISLKTQLEKKGYRFITQTDTEVIPHYMDYQLRQGKDMKTALLHFIKDAKGTFAILLFKKGEKKIYALKRDSPLCLGVCDNHLMLASDIYAFSDCTNKATFFEDEECAVVEENKVTFFNKQGKEIKKKPITFEWTRVDETKEHYDHYMIKEIKEQPLASKRVINSFETLQKKHIETFIKLIKHYKRIVFVAAGTSYHASLVGAILLTKLGYNARTIIASETETFISFDTQTLCIAISQSGETMDVVTVLKHARQHGAKVVSIVNVPYSTIQRMSETSIEILAGQEVCVAATKTFTNQLIVLFEIARRLGYPMDLHKIPQRIQQTIALNEDAIKELAHELYQCRDIYVLGRGMSYPMAREIALKLKEIPYIHAEGMMAGELKHGTIALIEQGTPVIALIPNNNVEMLSNTKEVEARGARVIIVSNTEGELHIPKCDDAEFTIYSCIIGHLLSYYIAILKGCSIDKPRNLAKSVTVK